MDEISFYTTQEVLSTPIEIMNVPYFVYYPTNDVMIIICMIVGMEVLAEIYMQNPCIFSADYSSLEDFLDNQLLVNKNRHSKVTKSLADLASLGRNLIPSIDPHILSTLIISLIPHEPKETKNLEHTAYKKIREVYVKFTSSINYVLGLMGKVEIAERDKEVFVESQKAQGKTAAAILSEWLQVKSSFSKEKADIIVSAFFDVTERNLPSVPDMISYASTYYAKQGKTQADIDVLVGNVSMAGLASVPIKKPAPPAKQGAPAAPAGAPAAKQGSATPAPAKPAPAKPGPSKPAIGVPAQGKTK